MTMNDLIMHNLIQLISTHTGIQIRKQDYKDFCNKIYSRLKILKLNTPEQYYEVLLKVSQLQSVSYKENDSINEWKELVMLLTIGETYFFRDRGQINLIKNKILPELITKNRNNCHKNKDKKPCLKIWSAGCSSGEEPYSLAIIVKQLIPDLSDWNILILGTDINPESIEKAQEGIYDSWSFRQVEPQIQKQYFHQRKMRWEVDRQIRKLVKFRCMNLSQEAFPNQFDLHNIDIIVCRNVFIYFNSVAIATVLEKFYQTLIPGGYLIAGHTELHGQNLGQLQPIIFPGSVVYQRSENLQVASSSGSNSSASKLLLKSDSPQENTSIKQKSVLNLNSSKNVMQTPTQGRSLSQNPAPETAYQSVLKQAEIFFHSGEYARAIQAAKQVILLQPKHFDAYFLTAQAWANLGESEQAIQYCQQALQVDNLSEKAYYLLAHIAEEKGDKEQAKALFKKIIYLTPSSIGAYLEISSIYAKEGDIDRAKKMLNTALELLNNLSAEEYVESYHKITASELLLQVKAILSTFK
ncbi:MAG TPA: chemotaxis protein CheR [Cyanobacteria bacterium UBA11049]|nr:chemotaxis protein CheR [Cyanobacteria bacterium UBA11049]